MNNNSRLVYSTDNKSGTCPLCDKPLKKCKCSKTTAPVLPKDGVVRISRQTKGRKGSGVSIITGIPLQGTELKKVAKLLKQKCGSGGTVKDGVVEIQGDHREILLVELQKKGWTTKIAGG
ncbi:MAG: translation initiation factor Sui1 [Desulfotalea sp.]